MSLTISIRFLTGRAHLHPWQTHHSEGRVEWPPSPWRLLRALVAVAGRGLTSLPYQDDAPAPKSELKVVVEGFTTLKKRGVPKEAQGNLSEPAAMADAESDAIPLTRLAQLLHTLSATATIWLPKTGGGHTRQYFPIHSGGMVKNSGSAVFDTFATVRKDQPLMFHWAELHLDVQQLNDLRMLLGRITYFGRAESWCRAEVHNCELEKIAADGMSEILPGKTHWECVCIEGTEHRQPDGREYRDYLLERRLAPFKEMNAEAIDLLPRTNTSDGKKRNAAGANALKAILQAESPKNLLLRCLLRESGQDIKDCLERPIGTRWVHYAVPREIYDVPRPKVQPSPRSAETVDFVRYALNTATVNRPVLPAITETLLVADRFRSAVMALCREPSQALSGHEADGSPSKDHQHAFWWPLDEDNDGFIDHVCVWAPGGFEQREIEALRRLTRLRQRGGRPDLLVTPVIVGRAAGYDSWSVWQNGEAKVFVSATPYFCPIHLSHGRGKSGRIRSLKREVIKGLQLQGAIESEDEVFDVEEIVFDYAPDELASVVQAIASHAITEPTSPRQFFPVTEASNEYPSLPKRIVTSDVRYEGASLKAADEGYCFGATLGLRVDHGTRFIRALSFCRRRREHELRGRARMLQITFCQPKPPQPFAIGSQCHFGLGLFFPANRREELKQSFSPGIR